MDSEEINGNSSSRNRIPARLCKPSKGVLAQAAQAYTMAGGAAHTTCTTPVAGSYFLCVATDGVWVSNNGSAYFQIVPPASVVAGVTSFAGRTGAVVPTAGDYSYQQLSPGATITSTAK